MFQPEDDSCTIITLNMPTPRDGGYGANNNQATLYMQSGMRNTKYSWTHHGFYQVIIDAIRIAEEQLRNTC